MPRKSRAASPGPSSAARADNGPTMVSHKPKAQAPVDDYFTPVSVIPDAVATARAAFRTGRTRDLKWRRRQIEGIQRMVTDHAEEFEAALRTDLGATKFWSSCIELAGTHEECNTALKNLAAWAAPRSVSSPVVLQPAASWVQPEPLGTILIIAPFNYPQNLLLMPLVAALAAGNTAVVKPSEVSEASARALGKYLPEYVDAEAVVVVQGAVPEVTALLKERYDKIIYTGSGAIAKIILRAAAEHLTPVLLELGGKCPAVVAPDADLSSTCKRIAFGKWVLNHGQSCLSPDYIITTPGMEDKIVAELKKTLKAFFGDKPAQSAEVSRIVNERHTRRVAALLDDDAIDVLEGGECDISGRYVAPTIVRAPADRPSKVMSDEIFGPILPVLTVPSVEAAVNYINEPSHGKPLGLYVFSSSSKTQDFVVGNTSSGGACINDCAVHHGNHELPFGGVGGSGMGAYHGKWGFDSCSHLKAVVKKYGNDVPLRWPPFSSQDLRIFAFLRTLDIHRIKTAGAVLLVLAFLVLLHRYGVDGDIGTLLLGRLSG